MFYCPYARSRCSHQALPYSSHACDRLRQVEHLTLAWLLKAPFFKGGWGGRMRTINFNTARIHLQRRPQDQGVVQLMHDVDRAFVLALPQDRSLGLRASLNHPMHKGPMLLVSCGGGGPYRGGSLGGGGRAARHYLQTEVNKHGPGGAGGSLSLHWSSFVLKQRAPGCISSEPC